jgi:hypothetical protein
MRPAGIRPTFPRSCDVNQIVSKNNRKTQPDEMHHPQEKMLGTHIHYVVLKLEKRIYKDKINKTHVLS